MDFQARIEQYKEDEEIRTSPIWIWYTKTEKGTVCALCKTILSQKNGSTGTLVNHLMRHHGKYTKQNAWKDYEELSSVKEERLKRKRKPEASEGPPKKQMKLADCANPKYSRQDPRHQERVNAIAMMMCSDADP